MNGIFQTLVVTVLMLATLSFSAEDEEATLSDQDRIALELGRQVIAVSSALKDPTRKEALTVVRELGTDSRYYVMVRGWVRQHIDMAESYRDTSLYRSSEVRKKEVDSKIAALRRMLRAIDLE